MKLKRLNYYLPFILLGLSILPLILTSIVDSFTSNLDVVIFFASILNFLFNIANYFFGIIGIWLIINGIILIVSKDKRIWLKITSIIIGIILLILAATFSNPFIVELY